MRQWKKYAEKRIFKFVSIELDLWGNHMMQKRKTTAKSGKCENVIEMESCCLWVKNKFSKRAPRLPQHTYISICIAHYFMLHFILFMIQRRVQRFAKIRQHSNMIQMAFVSGCSHIETNTTCMYHVSIDVCVCVCDEIECNEFGAIVPLQSIHFKTIYYATSTR